MTIAQKRSRHQAKLQVAGVSPAEARKAACRRFPVSGYRKLTRGPMGQCFICKSHSAACGHRERELVEFYMHATREERALLRVKRETEKPELPNLTRGLVIAFEDAWRRRA